LDIKQQDEKYEVGSAFCTNREETDANSLVEITRAKTGMLLSEGLTVKKCSMQV
jgi:hypothetical protein